MTRKARPLLRILRAIFLIAAIAGTPASASTDSKLGAALSELQQRDELVQSIGWKLITGNAPFCTQTRSAVGLLLQDVAAYPKTAPVRTALGLSGDIAVQARAAGSPAYQAGLPVHAEVLAIDDQQMRDLPPVGKERWRRLADLHRHLDETLGANGAIEITWRGAELAAKSTTLAAVPVCASRFEVIGGSKRASANGKRVAIGADFVGFTYSEELLAAAIAHELAHNLLGHPAWLDENGRKRRNVRITEREADRLMPWLLAAGGYDPAAAERFMRVWGPRHDGGLLRGRTHDGWDERAEFIAAELPLINQLQTQGVAADWSEHFVRDIQPLYSAASSSE